MNKERCYVVTLDRYDYGIIVNSLDLWKKRLAAANETNSQVNAFFSKAYYAPLSNIRKEERNIVMNDEEFDLAIRSLNSMRNELIREEKDPEVVVDVLIKIADAPKKRVRCDYDEAR